MLPPRLITRVTEHISEIIKFIERIISNGYAYVAPSGSVYFDVQKFPSSYMSPKNMEGQGNLF